MYHPQVAALVFLIETFNLTQGLITQRRARTRTATFSGRQIHIKAEVRSVGLHSARRGLSSTLYVPLFRSSCIALNLLFIYRISAGTNVKATSQSITFHLVVKWITFVTFECKSVPGRNQSIKMQTPFTMRMCIYIPNLKMNK